MISSQPELENLGKVRSVMNKDFFSADGVEQGRKVVTRGNSPTTQCLRTHYALTVRRRGPVK